MSGSHVYRDPHAICTHRAYKMTCAEYDALAERADGHCQLCGQVKRLVMDHDHALGRWAVRGLVCQKCNCEMRDVDSGRRAIEQRHLDYIASAWHQGRVEPDPFVDVKRQRPKPWEVERLLVSEWSPPGQ